MEADAIMKELFGAGMTMYFLSLFTSVFNPPVARMLRSVSYLCIGFFGLLVVFQLWETFNRFIEILESISKWRPDFNPFN